MEARGLVGAQFKECFGVVEGKFLTKVTSPAQFAACIKKVGLLNLFFVSCCCPIMPCGVTAQHEETIFLLFVLISLSVCQWRQRSPNQ
jgi:hypothetical protein